jgi:hypothetical protein
MKEIYTQKHKYLCYLEGLNFDKEILTKFKEEEGEVLF